MAALARHLAATAAPGEVVALLLPNSVEFHVAYFAAEGLGGSSVAQPALSGAAALAAAPGRSAARSGLYARDAGAGARVGETDSAHHSRCHGQLFSRQGVPAT